MSTDFIEDKETRFQKRRRLLPRRLRMDTSAGAFELSRQDPFVNGSQDIFDLLEQRNKDLKQDT